MEKMHIIDNYNTIKIFILVAIIIIISAIVQKKIPHFCFPNPSYDSPFYPKAKFISKIITAFSFIVYAIYLLLFINLETNINSTMITLIFILLYHVYIWFIMKISS
ncbi:hypothetical protein IZY60_14315 [Lutibacter sp. B2]|nr:hypothetical protein [Lutibacter sp. B2]